MPKSPKEFMQRVHYSVERWGFTGHELEEDYAKCRRQDVFEIGGIGMIHRDGSWVEEPEAAAFRQMWHGEMVRANRPGSNYNPSQFTLIQKPVSAFPQNEMDEEMSEWEWVKCTADGRFMSFYEYPQQEAKSPKQFLKGKGRDTLVDLTRNALERWGWTWTYDLVNVRVDFEEMFVNVGYKPASAWARLKFKFKQPRHMRDLTIKQQVVGTMQGYNDTYVKLIEIDQALPVIGMWTKTFCTNPNQDVPDAEKFKDDFGEMSRQLQARAVQVGQRIYGYRR